MTEAMPELYAYYVTFVCLNPEKQIDFGSCGVQYPKPVLNRHSDYQAIAAIIGHNMEHKPGVTVLSAVRTSADDPAREDGFSELFEKQLDDIYPQQAAT